MTRRVSFGRSIAGRLILIAVLATGAAGSPAYATSITTSPLSGDAAVTMRSAVWLESRRDAPRTRSPELLEPMWAAYALLRTPVGIDLTHGTQTENRLVNASRAVELPEPSGGSAWLATLLLALFFFVRRVS